MRLAIRFIVPLLLILTAIGFFVIPLVDTLTKGWFIKDLEIRGELITNTIHANLTSALEEENKSKIKKLFNQVTRDQRLLAIGFCSANGDLLYKTALFPPTLHCPTPEVRQERNTILNLEGKRLHVFYYPMITSAEFFTGNLLLVHDLGFIFKRIELSKKYVLYFFIALGILISLVSILVAELSWRAWVNSIRSALSGNDIAKGSGKHKRKQLQPILKDVKNLLRKLEAQQKNRDDHFINWGPQTLKEVLNKGLSGNEIIIVSNREPYIHHRDENGEVEVQLPASGLVTAMEPVMRACSGTWIAHGGGNADKDFVDEKDHVAVPPESPEYTLRRLWLTKAEEEGYYYGFANEGLWPLCHIAHSRPIFRSQDWEQYIKVNKKFTNAVIEEAKTDEPVILIQDYHFALLPRMIRNRLPKAIIITFWHIPWPNSEDFGICPWRDEIMDGLLASSILGFHTQFHCNNFMDTVDRNLESRIDREHSNIFYLGKSCAINPYPISIEWPIKHLKQVASIPECKNRVQKLNHIESDVLIGVGVDRLDYTKGIIERFQAVERLMELHPEWIGKFSFIEIAAPSRSSIESYLRFQTEVVNVAKKINDRFQKDSYKPIHLRLAHHKANQVFEHYRAAQLCFVSSLHDGMNLVAKEFISSRDDEQGVLLLSLFTGASKELLEALIVNPYDIDQCAEALHEALIMKPEEQQDRMKNMRALVREYNVYRWAGRILMDAAHTRQRNRFLRRLSKTQLQFSIE